MTKKCARLRSVTGLALVAAAVFGASSASAQRAAEGFSIGLAGGFSKASSIGYYVLATLEFPSPVKVLRMRADGLHADWGGGHVNALTANVLFTPVSGRRVEPYALAGAGAYTTGGSAVKSGWTLGAGLRLPGDLRAITLESRVHAFLRAREPLVYAAESRWQYVFAPIGLGIQF
jgi:hypothetical protein